MLINRLSLVVTALCIFMPLGACAGSNTLAAGVNSSQPEAEETSAPEPETIITNTPTLTNTPEPTPTAIPTPTVTPKPTMTATPEPTNTPEPTAAPTNTPEPTATPEPTVTPQPTNTPEPTTAPDPTDVPEPTATPVPSEPTADPVPTATPEPVKTVGQKPGAFAFGYNGVNISMGADANDIIAALGEPGSLFEVPSCAFDGIDKTLIYNGFEIYTYPAGGKDLVLSVVITGGVQTKEGLGLGMAYDDMVAIYGEDYSNPAAAYIYTAGGAELRVIIEGGVVTDISYYNLNA